MIKLKLMKLLCNTLYWCGHYWSRGVMYFEFMHWTYPVYNWLMCKSCDISDEYNLGIWTSEEE